MDALVSLFVPFLGQMPGEPSGCKPRVAEGALDEAEVDASFEQMGGGRMPQGMRGNAHLVNAGALFGFTEGALDSVAAHRLSGGGALLLITSSSGDKPDGVTVSGPGRSQKFQGVLRQGDGAVLGPFASVDMDHHAL
jgi:hypothetical protein